MMSFCMLYGPCHSFSYKRSSKNRSFSFNSTTRKKVGTVLVKSSLVQDQPKVRDSGHTGLLHGLGEVGDVPSQNMPELLRIAHVRQKMDGGDSKVALAESARGLMVWKASLERGLVPDIITLQQLRMDPDNIASRHTMEELEWPHEPLRSIMIKYLSQLGVTYFAKKYEAVRIALLKSILSTILEYNKSIAGVEDQPEERETDEQGNVYMTAEEFIKQQAQQRAARTGKTVDKFLQAQQQQLLQQQQLQARQAQEEEEEFGSQDWGFIQTKEVKIATKLVEDLINQWKAPVKALSNASKAFEGLEALLGGAAFDLQGGIWRRKGWEQLDHLRKKLEDLKELRDLVRSLGRGGGWGPLRRAPVQFLDLRGRPGLLRTVLEQQETRGLTRSDDISRLLPAEAALLSKGRTLRQAKLLFYARLAEKGLQTYERDGWGDFPTNIVPERREIRPTADRGPILLCVDTSGSMRGARETVAKALALECMRSAREQDRNCYVFAFSGPSEVEELELNDDLKSVNNLLDFLEKVFNGGSDFNEPVRRCLDRLTEAKWANSDILLVSDGELRQPGPEIMRSLSGAKQKLGLRVHGLIVGSPEKQRADPAVLRALCTNPLPNGSTELLVSRFENWAGVQADESMQFDWDDIEGDTKRRLAGLKHEQLRQQEMKRRRKVTRQTEGKVDKRAHRIVY
eukprot:TRINITY_DN4906_c0_g1_i1.p1 TRINITY_DN4906_c0_g1~~TRINITY_DN4906_c0_g1_i1.p1  ORF type:complete len:684 (-),score=92.29 TRINITY_DN4906_c0_g1_i1:237-2288(-)